MITILSFLSVFILGIAPAHAEQVACTMEAKLCPDGVTYVGRQGPNCAFAACPTSDESPSCEPYKCSDGTEVARCSDGVVINYFVAPCLTHGGEVDASASFKDVLSTHANAEAIAYVKAEGIVEGYTDGTYQPDQTINRAEFVKILIGAFDDDGRMCKISPFTDVAMDAWYGPSAHKARCNGIVSGYPDGTFRPSNMINFVEAAKILTKAFNLEAETTILACETSECPWYQSYVMMLELHAAIPTSISGVDQFITRGEMAEMIYRLKTGNNDKPSKKYEELNS